MPKFQKKPVVIEAVQFINTKQGIAAILRFIPPGIVGLLPSQDGAVNCLSIKTLEGIMRADPGDWIIRGVKGEFYPVKDEIFKETYDPVSAPTSESDGN